MGIHYLHSTMFLLIPYTDPATGESDSYLHSTMFLLIQDGSRVYHYS